MKLEIFGIFDVKINAYREFFTGETIGHCLRIFGDIVSNPNSAYYKHAEDFSCAHLASIEQSTGIVTPLTQPVVMELAVDASADHKRYYASLSIGQNTNSDFAQVPAKLAS